jgi:hypothetical protein
MVISFTKLRLFLPQSLLHYQHTFSTFAWVAVCRSRKTPCWSVGALDARCVSARRRPQNDALGVHLSVPIKHPPTSIFLAPWRIHSMDAVVRTTTTSWNTACVKSSDTSARRFTRPAYSDSGKGRKSVLVMKETLWKNNLNIVKEYPWYVHANFIIIVIIVSEKKLLSYRPSFIHTYIHTYNHTYIHTYIHTYTLELCVLTYCKWNFNICE